MYQCYFGAKKIQASNTLYHSTVFRESVVSVAPPDARVHHPRRFPKLGYVQPNLSWWWPKRNSPNHIIHGMIVYLDISENSGFSPQIIHFNRVFHYKSSILGYPYFWKHPFTYNEWLTFVVPDGSYGQHLCVNRSGKFIEFGFLFWKQGRN